MIVHSSAAERSIMSSHSIAIVMTDLPKTLRGPLAARVLNSFSHWRRFSAKIAWISADAIASSLTALRSFLKAAGEGLAAAGPPELLKGEDIVVGVGALPMAPCFES